MAKYKVAAEKSIEYLSKLGELETSLWAYATTGIISALLFIGEVLEKHLKDIATNTKRIGNS